MFLRWLFRIRLRRVEKKYSKEKRNTIQELYVRTQILDIRLLDNYIPAQGMEIQLWIGIHNAEQLIKVIDELSATFAEKGHIQLAGKVAFNRKMIRFDEFLVNDRNADVPIALFTGEFARAVAQLHTSYLTTTGDNIRRGYYQRKSEDFIIDLLDILEALEAIASAETT
jgi:Ran GTPase-activating protein (RanGAP) involved in mRNA processing and transport